MPLLILLAGLTSNIYAQISPGDLTTAHAKFEGIRNCTKCHVLGEKLHNSKCLDCHSEIKELQQADKGFHSSSEVKDKNCWSCHSEHNGRNFRIVNFDPDKFEHSKAGFNLEGKHDSIKCGECHTPKFISDPKLKKLKNTYLGLSDKCVSCHTDYHQDTLGEDCASCHNTVKFRPAPLFDHNKAKFVLDGAHIKVACEKCHTIEKKRGENFQRFTGLQFENCTPCHKDVHAGKLGKDCKSCHNTNSFATVLKSSFNHDLTDYPLLGKHNEVSCADCHGDKLSSKPRHQYCTDCHKDFHKGEFTVNGKIKDCSACHNVNGFKTSLYTVEDHNKIKFALTGGHLATPCGACHYKSGEWHFKNTGITCVDCHNNIHGSEISATFFPDNNCSTCHSTESWRQITFDHNKTRFKLSGKHADTDCGKCHLKKDNNGKVKSLFRSLGTNCETCHEDIHRGQFLVEGKTDCSRCHGFNDWKTVKFDHDKTRFPLRGAHKNLLCSKCHKETSAAGITFIKYKLQDYKCAFCHSS